MTPHLVPLATSDPQGLGPQPTHEPAAFRLDELTIPRLIYPLGRNCIRPRRHRIYNRGVRAAVYEAAGHRCVRCGKPEGRLIPAGYDDEGAVYTRIDGITLTLHHVHPFNKGGCNHAHNLVALCSGCNTLIGSAR